MTSDTPAPKRNTSAFGQAMEFSIWTELIQQSRGALHIFLPLLDCGLDAVAHNLLNGDYIKLKLALTATSLVDDQAVIIAGVLNDDGLGPYLLVVYEGTFKRMAARNVVNGKEVFEATPSIHPTDASHWRPYLVPCDGLAARLLGTKLSQTEPYEMVEAQKPEPGDRHNQRLGFLGEAEVIRRLAESSHFDLVPSVSGSRDGGGSCAGHADRSIRGPRGQGRDSPSAWRCRNPCPENHIRSFILDCYGRLGLAPDLRPIRRRMPRDTN